MKVLVFGGTGRTGGLIVEQLLVAGHEVTVAGRRDPNITGVPFLETDLFDKDAVQHLASGFDASISALASAKGNLVCAQLAEALRNTTDLRFITIGGAGVDDLGDDKGFADKAVGWVMRRIVPEMLQDRQTELAILKKSALRWTMLRPGRLTDKAGGDTISLTYDRPATSAIARADLAKVAVNTLTDDLLVNKAPFVAEKKK